jgi:hypothetical protein
LFKLLSVDLIRLEVVRDYYYRDEGCDSPDAFEEAWRTLHPRAGVRPEQLLYLHRFVLIGTA